MELPKECSSSLLTHCYTRLIAEKYPNEQKLRGIVRTLGLEHAPLEIQIIVIQQLRDQLHKTSPRILSTKQRDKILYEAIIPFLEDLENQLQDFEEYLLEGQEEDEEEEEEKEP